MNIIDYIGKFHPLAVHLPIGILSLFIVLVIFIPRAQLQQHKPVVRILLLLSALSATLSSLSGYLMANSGAYMGDLVTGHQVLGISLTVLNWLLLIFLNYLFECKRSIYRAAVSFMLILIVLTGHAGGSITHGADFLSPPPVSSWFSSEPIEDEPITLESSAFEAAEQIFSKKCLVCHGKSKQKGELRLDTKDHLIKGGENGNLLGNSQNAGLLIERILLPEDDDDHMPPIERKQLTELEINFLSWWIKNGADFDKSLSELSFPETLHPMLTANNKKPSNSLIPEKEIKKANEDALNELKRLDVIVLPVGSDNNYLSVSFVNVLPENIEKSLLGLNGIQEQLIWLDLDYQLLDSLGWNMLSKFTELRKLSLKDANLDDNNISFLNKLEELRYLSLVGTNISKNGLSLLNNLTNLESLFLYQTDIRQMEQEEVAGLFRSVNIDFGNYVVPTLPSDTTIFSKKDL